MPRLSNRSDNTRQPWNNKPYYKKRKVFEADDHTSIIGSKSPRMARTPPASRSMEFQNSGQDLPGNSAEQALNANLSPSSQDRPNPQKELTTNGIHPSRLALFGIVEPKEDLSPTAEIKMAPPPGADPKHRSHPSHHSQNPQQRANLNGLNVNGVQQHSDQKPSDQQDRNQQPRQSNGALPVSMGHGPMPSHIQVAKPYVFQQAIEGCLKEVGVAQAREDSIRLAGVQWIDSVRRVLKLPVRTFDTAVIYYHKFRLVHSDGEYSFVDAAAASLFAACKIEDTLKKSRDILCAAHNLKIQNRAEHLSPDDAVFEHPSRTIIGLERLMLESSSFDFRNRHPQHILIKLAKHYGLTKSSPIVKTAYTICLDLYRTFAPLKQGTATLAFACLELSARLLNETEAQPCLEDIISGKDYDKWNITRAEIMETLLDLLELYTHYRTSTVIGPDFNLDIFLEVRIPLNEELNENNLPRFTEYIPTTQLDRPDATGSYAATVNGISAAAAATAAINGAGAKHDRSPTSPITPGGTTKQNGVRQKAGERGREGTVRFMLNPDRERQERAVVAEYGVTAPGLTGVVNADVLSTGPSTPTGARR